MMKKHPDVIKKGSQIPMNDLLEDPIVFYQRKYYIPLALFFCLVLPTIVPVLLWNENVINAYFITGILKYVVTLHATWLVNSVAHFWGFKPYDKKYLKTPFYSIQEGELFAVKFFSGVLKGLRNTTNSNLGIAKC